MSLNQLPLHARAGSILPFGPVLQSAAEVANDRIDLYVVPGRDAVFDLYEDQGTDNGYEKGESATTRISWSEARGELRIASREGSYPGMPRARRLTVRKMETGVTPLTPAPGYVVEYSGQALVVAL